MYSQYLKQHFSATGSSPRRRHLTMPGEVLGRHLWGKAVGIWTAEARATAKAAGMHRTAPPHPGIIKPNMSVGQRVRNHHLKLFYTHQLGLGNLTLNITPAFLILHLFFHILREQSN